MVVEFDIYPIDIYRQKSDADFIGALNVYQLSSQQAHMGLTSTSMVSDLLLLCDAQDPSCVDRRGHFFKNIVRLKRFRDRGRSTGEFFSSSVSQHH
jgi:hypothetical protein